MKLLHKLVLLKPDTNDKSDGGIYLIDNSYKNTGTIIALGSDIEDSDLSIGDKIMYENYAGTKISIDNEEYVLIYYNDIVAKINF